MVQNRVKKPYTGYLAYMNLLYLFSVSLFFCYTDPLNPSFFSSMCQKHTNLIRIRTVEMSVNVLPSSRLGVDCVCVCMCAFCHLLIPRPRMNSNPQERSSLGMDLSVDVI